MSNETPTLRGLNTTEWWVLLVLMVAKKCQYTQMIGFNEYFTYVAKTPGGDYYEIDEFSEMITRVTKLKQKGVEQ